MCRCTPEIRTPFCGKIGCEAPKQRIDVEGVRLEALQWYATGELRWLRPPRSMDDDRVLQQLWERTTGEREWRAVPLILAD